MRLADPELASHGAPWEQLISVPDSALPAEVQACIDIPEEETAPAEQEDASAAAPEEAGPVRIHPPPPVTRPAPLRRRHTLGESINCTLQPLLPRKLSQFMGQHPEKAPDAPSAFRYRRQSRFSSRRVRRRVVFKQGDCNVVQTNVAKRRRRYLQDIFTTLVDAQWRWTLLVFALNFMLSWLAFALVWYAIAAAHGDLGNRNSTQTPCVTEMFNFTACFLFSVETQHTIGYGSRSTTGECPEAVILMCLQCITGVMTQAFMVGIVFAKLSRPKKRTQTLLFSRNAVICQRDGQLCLMFRVGDMRRSHIVEAHVRAQVIRQRVSPEGEVIPFYQHELKVGGDGGEDDRIFFIWPTTIVHRIDSSSPLYRVTAGEMLRERFEIVVILEGVVESTGMTTQARSSYLPSEVLWGHRFEPMVWFRKERGEYEVDYSKFNNTYEVETPLCSGEALDQVRRCTAGLHPKGLESRSVEPGPFQRRLPAPPSQPPSPAEEREEAEGDSGGCSPSLDLPGPESRI